MNLGTIELTRRNWQTRAQPADLRVGCSGWQYKHWRGEFYPVALPLSHWLEYYAERFDTVEINNSFYRLPEAATFADWHARVLNDFVYAVKASRFLTHIKKLKDPEGPLDRFFRRVGQLEGSLGPVLYQLPPGWHVNLDRLNTFVAALPPGHRHVLEFRDPTWYVDQVYDTLTRHGVAMCLHDMAGAAPPNRRLVGPFIYLRFHGPQKYGGRYSNETLADWATWCAARLIEGTPVYAYFNNDIGGHAPRDAVRLRNLIAHATRGEVAMGPHRTS
jgi:uncharacterized protein YecE (DUF72 family)